ncbi:glycosyltransferase [Ramlibacter sp. XY19]|uniref:glycosyltransferase n=1 Tax=Ramlibacter paludis TaxID=2908000 RepID=UPI0023DCB36E|nr:glycosyltransferase [Ramlibacter paludis]MCG2591234.1 glycosyltransferase [Ramlibacter paludis]
MAKVLLSAFGIHSGGGRVLLDAILRELKPELKAVALDARMRGHVDTEGVACEFVRPSMAARLRSLQRLAGRACQGDVLFCFNNLPPLRGPAGGRVIVYMQGRHLLAPDPGIRYPTRTALRVAIERWWLRLGIRNCDEMWVQTPTMAELARQIFPGLAVHVRPFCDAAVAEGLLANEAPTRALIPPAENATFFYPADAAAHKNHVILLAAWQRLAVKGCRPLLYLTLDKAAFARLARSAGLEEATGPRIINLGELTRSAVLHRMAQSSALLFASSLESFGLPLLEARSLGMPILAAERDFVRDVCIPRETFDPASARSIEAAVLRFLAPGLAPAPSVVSAREFVRVLLE